MTLGLHGAAVPTLLGAGRPSHVSGLVVAVIVDAVKRVRAAGAFSNVGKKRLEVVAPFVAKANAATAVVGVGMMLRKFAAGLGVIPRLVFWRLRASVRARSVASGFAPKAAAALGMAILEHGAVSRLGRAAIALTKPARVVVVRPVERTLNHNQSPESLARKIQQFKGSSTARNNEVGVLHRGQFYHAD